VPTRAFAVTFDYRCPFARNAHEHLLAALAGGADWDVAFTPLSLGQMHVEEGGTSVWDDPTIDSGLWALQAGTVVRDRHPERFAEVHRALFGIRHDRAEKLEPAIVTATLAEVLGAEAADAVAETVSSGAALAVVRKEHEAVTSSTGPGAWGVPTFVTGDHRAVFVRLMDRNPGLTAEDQAAGRSAIERILDLLEWTELNEFKATRIPR
jgi:2-hydroxychromene-2-carboxylate isomerase